MDHPQLVFAFLLGHCPPPLLYVISWLLGLMDLAAIRLFGSLSSIRFFDDGLGDLPHYHARVATMWNNLHRSTSMEEKNSPKTEKNTCASSSSSLSPLWLDDSMIRWGNQTRDGPITIQKAHFLSPLAHDLPQLARYSELFMIRPTKDHDGQHDHSSSEHKRDVNDSNVFIVMIPGTGEMGISDRYSIAKALAKDFGWNSILMTAPYYKHRRPKHQTACFLTSVQDGFWQGQACAQEAAAVTAYLMRKSSDSLICLTGFSFGAACANFAAQWALALPSVDGHRLAVCSYVGCASARPYANGAIEHVVHWKALQQHHTETENDSTARASLQEECQEVQRRRLLDALSQFQLKHLAAASWKSTCNEAHNEKDKLGMNITRTGHVHQRPHVKVVKACHMRHDGIIKPIYGLELQEQIKQCLLPPHGSLSSTKFEMKWLPGGHLFAHNMRPLFHRQLLIETVRELKPKTL